MKTVPDIKMPFFSYILQSLNDPINFRTKLFQHYGDIARKKIKGRYNYSLNHPAFAQHILNDNQENYFRKGQHLYESASPFLGTNSIFLTKDYEQWQKDRHIAKAHFEQAVYFQNYAQTIVSLCDQMLQDWEKSGKNITKFNVMEEMDLLIVKIVVNTLFTHLEHFSAQDFLKIIPRVVESLKTRNKYLIKSLWHISPAKKKYLHCLDSVKKLTTDVVKRRLQEKQEWDDLISHFLREYRSLSREQLIDDISYHVTTFLAVSYFTSSSLLHWLIVTLSIYPHAMQQIREELTQKVGSRLPNYQDLSSLTYLSATIKETLRLHSPIFVIMRESAQKDEMNGFPIEANSGIALSTYHIHRHPDFWENPEGFDPTRFIDNPLGQAHRFAFIPFGAGMRNCIGSAFSTMEVSLIITMILQRFNIFLPAYTEVKPTIVTPIVMRPDVKIMYRQSLSN